MEAIAIAAMIPKNKQLLLLILLYINILAQQSFMEFINNRILELA